jgi:hypothetical protein
MRLLQERLIADELGSLAGALPVPNPVFLERVFRNTQGAEVWCDDVGTTVVEVCGAVAAAALDLALVQLGGGSGTLPAGLDWGDVHQALHDHTVLGRLPLIAATVNIHQPASGGDDTLLRGLTSAVGERPFCCRGTSLRRYPRRRLPWHLRHGFAAELGLCHRHGPVRPLPFSALPRLGTALGGRRLHSHAVASRGLRRGYGTDIGAAAAVTAGCGFTGPGIPVRSRPEAANWRRHQSRNRSAGFVAPSTRGCEAG